jgi:hypothetical protein
MSIRWGDMHVGSVVRPEWAPEVAVSGRLWPLLAVVREKRKKPVMEASAHIPAAATPSSCCWAVGCYFILHGLSHTRTNGGNLVIAASEDEGDVGVDLAVGV